MLWPAIVIDRHALAIVSLGGVLLNGMGGLYLAYDLLGGPHGPLRTLTRIVTYALFFIIGYSLAFGLLFGLVAGTGFGLALGVEYGRQRPRVQTPPLQVSPHLLGLGLFRGLVLLIAATLAFGWHFGVLFGVLAGGGILVQYTLGFSPSDEYPEGGKPRVRQRAIVAATIRSAFTGGAGMLAGMIAIGGWQALLVGIKVGLVIGLVSGAVSIFTPLIEWWADHLPARRLGAFGTILLLLGLVLQSLEYWITLFTPIPR